MSKGTLPHSSTLVPHSIFEKCGRVKPFSSGGCGTPSTHSTLNFISNKVIYKNICSRGVHISIGINRKTSVESVVECGRFDLPSPAKCV